MSSTIACVAVIGKKNQPLYIAVDKPAEALKLHFLVHSSLDIVEEKMVTKSQAQETTYLGLLNHSEEYRVFGQLSGTKEKFVVVLEVGSAREGDIKQIFRELLDAYINVVRNTFYQIDDEIKSAKFEAAIRKLMAGRR